VELGRSADGTHMAQTPAGSRTGSVKNAAGPHDNAQCHVYHKNTTVTKTETTGPGPGEDDSLTLRSYLFILFLSVY